MFFKILLTSIFALVLSAQVSAHAIISPALGVKAAPVRNDVQRPSSASPCGNVNIAQTLDASTPVTASKNGSFAANVTNFNG